MTISSALILLNQDCRTDIPDLLADASKSSRSMAGGGEVSDTRMIHDFHAVLANQHQDPEGVREIFLACDRHDSRMRDLVQQAEARGIRVATVDQARLDGMAKGESHPKGIAQVGALQRYVTLDDALDGLQERHATAAGREFAYGHASTKQTLWKGHDFDRRLSVD